MFRPDPIRIAYLFLGSLLLFVILRNAWISDDIYITFRTLFNFTHGHGLTWNLPERVQTYTHPLWLFSLLPGYALTGQAYWTALVTAMLCNLAILIWIWKIAREQILAIGMVLLLLGSRAFIDFSTSGLENPLSNLLLLVFAYEWLSRGHRPGHMKRLAFWAALLMLNRLDHAVLVAPVLFVQFRKAPSRSQVRELLTGLIPLLAWLAFSVIYYGFPFPNTYYAKVLTDFPKGWILEQGLVYFKDSLQSDWLTLPVVAIALFLGFRSTNRRLRPLLLGALLYCLYIIWVGGDFMSGRFFVTPFLLALIVLGQLDWRTGLLPKSGFLPGIGKPGQSSLKTPKTFSLKTPKSFSLRKPKSQRLATQSDEQKTKANQAAIAHRQSQQSRFLYFSITLLLIALVHPYQPIKTGKRYYDDRRGNERALFPHGIVDEKGMAWERTALLRIQKASPFLQIDQEMKTWGPWTRMGPVETQVAVGFRGYKAGPAVFMVDRLALTDPLLARLPAIRVPYWRIGHFFRRYPEGYLESLRSDSNQVRDPNMAEYYDRLNTVTRGPLFSLKRWKEIFRFNFGLNQYLIDKPWYKRYPPDPLGPNAPK